MSFVLTNGTTVVGVKGIIHDTVIKSFDSVIQLNYIFLTSPNCSTVVEVKEMIPDTVKIKKCNNT